MREYDHKKIERKWQKYWDTKKTYKASDPGVKSRQLKTQKFYALMEFPYPSGDGLHTGHVRGYTAMDIIARKRRMEGQNVLYPIGWDAFGLPTENYAIKTGKQPALITKQNTDNFRKQFKSLGMSFDWSREINTTDPKYYKWTQWIFLQMLKKGLAYKAKIAINWCPKDKIGLANEEVVGGACERCGSPVEKREKEQWMLAITKYADRLDKDLDTVDFKPEIKLAQRNWIGKSEGAEIDFEIAEREEKIKVFTTRPDTIFGATFLAVAPEVARKLTGKDFGIKYDEDKDNKDKIGKDTGLKAINPASKEQIPVWVVNYVSADYGTGAIMGVPADDDRDNEFARKYTLPVLENYKKAGVEDFGEKVTKFKLRDWVFSRQRYWGEPIPVVNCEKCALRDPSGQGYVPVPEKDLPVKLPAVKNYQPTDNGESPLANISKWVNTKCPKCKGRAKRETDTMPNWAGSSWYFLRYVDPKNSKAFADTKKLKYWLGSDPRQGGVNWYNGGFEHTTLHLLYSRFWHKFLFDLGLVPTSEPYMKRTSHGIILAPGGEKMSKSRGNVINPDIIVQNMGADTLRLYEMFMGPFDQAVAWSEDGIVGPRRFLERVYKLVFKVSDQKNSSISRLLNKITKKVSEDIEEMRFNTAVSSLMIFINELEKLESIPKDIFENFLKLLAPFAPHISEELWNKIGNKNSVHISKWPEWREDLVEDETVKIVIQVNGKVRAEFDAPKNISESDAKDKSLSMPEVKKWLEGQTVRKIIFVPGRLINIVV